MSGVGEDDGAEDYARELSVGSLMREMYTYRSMIMSTGLLVRLPFQRPIDGSHKEVKENSF